MGQHKSAHYEYEPQFKPGCGNPKVRREFEAQQQHEALRAELAQEKVERKAEQERERAERKAQAAAAEIRTRNRWLWTVGVAITFGLVGVFLKACVP